MDVLASMIFKHLGPAQMFACARVCKYWNKILNNKKMMQKILRDLCQNDLWPRYIAQSSQTFLQQFKSWRHMIKIRPRIRFDGVYIKKIHYIRYGMTDING